MNKELSKIIQERSQGGRERERREERVPGLCKKRGNKKVFFLSFEKSLRHPRPFVYTRLPSISKFKSSKHILKHLVVPRLHPQSLVNGMRPLVGRVGVQPQALCPLPLRFAFDEVVNRLEYPFAAVLRGAVDGLKPPHAAVSPVRPFEGDHGAGSDGGGGGRGGKGQGSDKSG